MRELIELLKNAEKLGLKPEETAMRIQNLMLYREKPVY